MPEYDPRAELAPRDVVSQAIVDRMEKTQHPCVYLDLSAPADADAVRRRFPGIAKRCREFGLDIATDRIPVRPGAHYMIGGVKVDEDGRTTLPRPVGRGRSHLQRPARRQSPGVEQPARRPGLRRPRRRGRVSGGARRARLATRRPAGKPAGRRRRASSSTCRTSATRSRASCGAPPACGATASGLRDAARTIDGWQRYVLAQQFADPAGLGAAEHAHRGPRDDRRRPAPRGIPRRAPAHRLSRSRTTSTGASGWAMSAKRRRGDGVLMQNDRTRPRGRGRSLRYRHAKTRGLGLRTTVWE